MYLFSKDGCHFAYIVSTTTSVSLGFEQEWPFNSVSYLLSAEPSWQQEMWNIIT